MGAARRLAGRVDPSLTIAALVALIVFWIAYDDGSYELASRGPLAIAVWWAVILGIALRLLTAERLTTTSLLVAGLLAAFAYWTLASYLWSPSGEDAFNEFNRVSLYLAICLFALLAARRSAIGRWVDGLAIAIAAIGLVALGSRVFPGMFSDRELGVFLPSAVTRLSFPLGYWNGLAIFVGLGLPLLLRLALVSRTIAGRGLALAPIPVIACVIYLASSRGGVVTAVLGTLVFLGLTERRWSAAAAVAVAGVASVAAVAVLLQREELVNGPLGTDLVRDQGHTAALAISALGIATAVVYAAGCLLVGPRISPSQTVGRLAAGVAALVSIVLILASDPVKRFEAFKTPPQELEALEPGDFVNAHLLSASGSGRWQLWSSAVDQSEENLVLGDGAGSYEHWWAEHATIDLFVRDAHSFYAEALGELGIVGFVLVVALVLAATVIGVRRSLRLPGETRITGSAISAVFVAFAGAAMFEWIWELTAVSVVGFIALGLVAGPAMETYGPLRSASAVDAGAQSRRRRFGLGILAVLTAWILIVAQAIPLLANREIGRSQEAVARLDLDSARDAAELAREIQPWAETPYLQLALVSERTGDLLKARAWIEEAIERDSRDWRLWLVSARLETKLGNVRNGERSLRRAVALNPRSPLFSGLNLDT